ncbi:MAG: LptF/LptG family permease, partial [Candidatus Eremiobacteraeota bacterium]|nr:LptF/LptG family permease [Candidatus Eremiobacteraeota bacterium]
MPDAPQVQAPPAPARLDWLAGARVTSGMVARARDRYRVSILDRYLLAEFAAPFAFAVAAFTLFMLVNAFFLAADYIINKSVPFGLVMRYIVLQIPSFVYLILPFATL